MRDVSVAIPDQVSVRLDWSEVETCQAQHANQILTQVGAPTGSGRPDGVYVAVGSISPPVIPPDPEERAKRVAELTQSVVRVNVQARFHLSREGLEDFIKVLQRTAEQYDAAVALISGPGAQEQG